MRINIVPYFENLQMPYPKEIPKNVIDGWRKRDRTIQYGPYPVTLFYCGNLYHSIENVEGTDIRFPVVRSLPFPLECSDQKIEVAQALDYDGDGFPQVFVMDISPGEGRLLGFNTVKATDDHTNTISEKFLNRKK
ncbi:MAG: hypothetical protein HY897_21645 [Deltaproteobacteria bacterium]|nr:hypothetical protein [Deltaproteobacteria bacterium]